MEAIKEINLDGFKVVSSDFFNAASRSQLPMFTIWNGIIGFSKQDYTLLNGCENILIQINLEQRRILVLPTTSKDKDAIPWVRREDPFELRKPVCPRLTEQLYEEWNWDKKYNYRSIGKLVTAGNKVMLLFDFNTPEKWKRAEKKNGK